jgi:hypothetical protein
VLRRRRTEGVDDDDKPAATRRRRIASASHTKHSNANAATLAPTITMTSRENTVALCALSLMAVSRRKGADAFAALVVVGVANATDIATAAGQVGAFALPSGSPDAALLVTLSAGAYTATVSGAGGTTGTALVEIYVVP